MYNSACLSPAESTMADVPVGGGRISLSSMPPTTTGIFPATET